MQTQKAMQTTGASPSPVFVEAEKLVEQMQKLVTERYGRDDWIRRR